MAWGGIEEYDAFMYSDQLTDLNNHKRLHGRNWCELSNKIPNQLATTIKTVINMILVDQ